MSAGGYFTKTALILLAQIFDPLGCSLFQLGMIFVFPRASHSFKGGELLPADKLSLSGLADEAAALPNANYGINLFDQLAGENYMCAFGVHVAG